MSGCRFLRRGASLEVRDVFSELSIERGLVGVVVSESGVHFPQVEAELLGQLRWSRSRLGMSDDL